MYVRGKRYIAVGLLLASLSISGCPRQTLHADTTEVHPDRRVSSRKEGISIVPPAGYRDNGPSFWHVMNFLGPAEGDFTVNFNIWAHTDKGLDIEQAGPVLQQVAATHMPKYQLLEDGFRDLPHGKTYFACGLFRWAGRDVKCITYCLRGGNGRIYAITYSAPAETFDTHRPHFDASIETVQTMSL